MSSEYSARYAAADEHHAWSDIQERWASYMEKRPHHEGVLEVDLQARTAVLHPMDGEREPVQFQDIGQAAYRELIRRGVGAVQNQKLELPVAATEERDGTLAWAGVSANDAAQANMPNLAGTVNDVSLEAQLGWNAANMALRILDHIKADEQTNYMSGNGPALHPIRESIRELMGQIENDLPDEQLHKDHEYIVAAQVLAILDATQTRAETGPLYRLADGRNRIANLRALCAQREEAMAVLDGGENELREAMERRERAEEILAQTRTGLKRSGIATSIAIS